ncbi:MAG: SDR family oxidoreductase [Rhizobacter sp.]|nr:SDR family oxidoreductase [Chlorobiales bacterium]
MQKKILLTGASGLLGGNILQAAASDPHTHLLALHRDADFIIPPQFRTSTARDPATIDVQSMDLASHTELWNILSLWKPGAVIHTAAMADPATCERYPEAAETLNFTATRILADVCEQLGIRLVFISTDLVFDGTKDASEGFYKEDAARNPVSLYARTKVRAEDHILNALENAMILRTSVMFGQSPRGTRSLNERLLLDYKQNKSLVFFEDEYRTPVDVSVLARIAVDAASNDLRGVYHAVGSERVSRAEIARRLCAKYGIDTSLLKFVKLSDARSFPERPPDCSLDNSKLLDAMNLVMPSMDEVISRLQGL